MELSEIEVIGRDVPLQLKERMEVNDKDNEKEKEKEKEKTEMEEPLINLNLSNNNSSSSNHNANDLSAASSSGDMEKLHSLVEAVGCQVSLPDGGGYYPLQWSALNGRFEAAHYLLQASKTS